MLATQFTLIDEEKYRSSDFWDYIQTDIINCFSCNLNAIIFFAWDFWDYIQTNIIYCFSCNLNAIIFFAWNFCDYIQTDIMNCSPTVLYMKAIITKNALCRFYLWTYTLFKNGGWFNILLCACNNWTPYLCCSVENWK